TGVLRWPSDWRKLEIDTPPGAELSLVLDRAGTQVRAALTTAPRARPAQRETGARFREDAKVGVVLRTATEVEARAADLGPGGGAVIVGLARASPWRGAGLVFGDLVMKVDGESVAHPEVLRAAMPTISRKRSRDRRRSGAPLGAGFPDCAGGSRRAEAALGSRRARRGPGQAHVDSPRIRLALRGCAGGRPRPRRRGRSRRRFE